MFKQNTVNAILFQATADLFNNENLKVAITTLGIEVQVSNFPML